MQKSSQSENKKVVTLSEKEAKFRKIIEKKLEIARHPLSVVVKPATKEGHLLTDLAKYFDRVFWFGVRANIGAFTPIEETRRYMERAQDIIKKFSVASGTYLQPIKTPEEKYYDAQKLRSHVFIPRTQEGRQLALLVEPIDNKILIAKSTDTTGVAIETISNFIKLYGELLTFVEEIIESKHLDIILPGRIRRLSNETSQDTTLS